ncbi:MAG TPA: rhomboid family intramembrane serine protease [Solirubrobacteraceae bacterium]|nr:rhomboid family intramembrane serine protease [Solirubrobacteraceae bacterium]
MSSRPDLFVICKSCGSEVSPYVTECPYCGKRLRKRAPKIERGGDGPAKVREPRLRRRRRQRDSPRLSRLRAGEIPGVRGDETARPLATIALVIAGLVFLVLFQAEILLAQTLGLTPLTDLGVSGEGWRLVTSLFTYSSVVAQFTTLLVVAVFGWLLERRHGSLLVLVLFFVAGVAGNAAASALGAGLTLGGGGGALARVGAWALPVVSARRRDGGEDEADLLGTGVLAAMLVVLAVVVDFASPVATAVGGLVGVLAGVALGALRPR